MGNFRLAPDKNKLVRFLRWEQRLPAESQYETQHFASFSPYGKILNKILLKMPKRNKLTVGAKLEFAKSVSWQIDRLPKTYPYFHSDSAQ